MSASVWRAGDHYNIGVDNKYGFNCLRLDSDDAEDLYRQLKELFAQKVQPPYISWSDGTVEQLPSGCDINDYVNYVRRV